MTQLSLYEFALPDYSNDGKLNYEGMRDIWETTALELAGGFTRLGKVRGCWRDGVGGDVYEEDMHGYRVACTSEIKDELLQRAFYLFPDQLAIFVAQIGTATIVSRPKVAA